MIRDKRGEGGFMEAIMALMFVTIALTTFFGILAYSELGNVEGTIDLDTDFIEDLVLKEGKLSGETRSHLQQFIERNHLNGARLDVIVAGPLCNASLRDSVGDANGDNVGSFTGTFPVNSDDGRTFVATYEVVYWWD